MSVQFESQILLDHLKLKSNCINVMKSERKPYQQWITHIWTIYLILYRIYHLNRLIKSSNDELKDLSLNDSTICILTKVFRTDKPYVKYPNAYNDKSRFCVR